MSQPPKLSVNLNKPALLRNARPLDIPRLTDLARQCIHAGAHGITVHPRPDQRHIRFSDVDRLADCLSEFPAIEYNIEGNPFTGLLDMVKRVRPAQCTLVPDSPEQSTSDHGWDVAADGQRLTQVIAELQRLGVRVSLFMDPDLQQLDRLAALDPRPERIELYTEPYASAFGGPQQQAVLARYRQAVARARELGFGVNAGHDLNLDNLPELVAIGGILECSIGHALTCDALSFGLTATVGKYLHALGWRDATQTAAELPAAG